MKKVGLTGGIGSGKTIIAKIFELLNVPVYYSDLRAKHILFNHPEVYRQLKTTFGNRVFTNNKIDKQKLAKIVFEESEQLKKLNRIIHPLVADDFEKWCTLHSDKLYIIKEAAILFESGAYRQMDEIICVTAPENIRIQRVIERDGVSEKEVKERMKHQWTDSQRAEKSNYRIVNDETCLVIPQVLNIHQKLLVE
jgi:dephospho-CoA kinase